jgi:hypothetical protein
MAASTPTAPRVIRTHAHHGSPPPEPAGVVCVACTLTVADLATVAVLVLVLVAVWVAVLVAVWVEVWVAVRVLVTVWVAALLVEVALVPALVAVPLAAATAPPLTMAAALPSRIASSIKGSRAVDAIMTCILWPAAGARNMAHTPARNGRAPQSPAGLGDSGPASSQSDDVALTPVGHRVTVGRVSTLSLAAALNPTPLGAVTAMLSLLSTEWLLSGYLGRGIINW